jgi:AcrR family transcriptional regulator
MTSQSTTGRANQKLRTRAAIVKAATELSRTGREVTMPEVAEAALVSSHLGWWILAGCGA